MKFKNEVSALCGVVLTCVLSNFSFGQDAPPNPRVALVIGEAAYPDHPLATTANDAGLVAQTLQAAGFDVVGARDLDEKSLRQALRDFIDKANAAGPDGVDFVYLSGRALQYSGDNYFVPVDAQITRDVDVPIEAIKISDFTHALAAAAGRSHVVVVDGARANNYASQTPLAPGLALVDPEKGELVAFNAAPGTVAPEENGPFGVFGKDLAGALRQGGVPLDDIFAQTRVQVSQDTQGAVVPWSASALAAPVYIFDRAANTQPPAAIVASETLSRAPLRTLGPERAYTAAVARDSFAGYQDYLAAYPNSPEARRVRAMLAARREASFWRHCVGQDTPGAYWTYLKRYPNGPHVADAGRRLAMLSQPEAPPADFEPVDFADLPPPPPDEDFYEERPIAYFGGDDFGPPPPPPPPDFVPSYGDDWRDLPPPSPPRSDGYLPVLPIAVPLIAGAIAVDYLHRKRSETSNNGVAPPRPAGAPQAAPGRPTTVGQTAAPPAIPLSPPPLPKGITPKPPPPAQATSAPLLIPGTQGARPVSTAPFANQVHPTLPAAPQSTRQGAPTPVAPPTAPAPATNGAPQAPSGHQLPTPLQSPASPPSAKPLTRQAPAGATPSGTSVPSLPPNDHALPTPSAPQTKPAAQPASPAPAPQTLQSQTPAATPHPRDKAAAPTSQPTPHAAPLGGASPESPSSHSLPAPTAAPQVKPTAPSSPAVAAPHAPDTRHEAPKPQAPAPQPAPPNTSPSVPAIRRATPPQEKLPPPPAAQAPAPHVAPPAAPATVPQARPVAPAAAPQAQPHAPNGPAAPPPKAPPPTPAAHAPPPPPGAACAKPPCPKQ
jgi:uncharacterized caspase-like protein